MALIIASVTAFLAALGFWNTDDKELSSVQLIQLYQPTIEGALNINSTIGEVKDSIENDDYEAIIEGGITILRESKPFLGI